MGWRRIAPVAACGLAFGAAFWGIRAAVIRGDPSNAVAAPNGGAPAAAIDETGVVQVNRQEISIPNDPESGTSVKSPSVSLRACLRSEDIRACLARFPFDEIDIEGLAGILADDGYSLVVRAELLKYFMLSLAPYEALPVLDMLASFVGDEYRIKILFEVAILATLREHGMWADLFAETLTGPSLFSDSETVAGVLMASELLAVRPELAELLEEGALGKWGGREFTIRFAFYDRLLSRAPVSSDALELVNQAIDSPHLQDRAAALLAPTVVMELLDMGARDSNAVPGIEAALLRLLAEERFAFGAARQYYFENQLNPTSFLSDEANQLLLLEIERVLVDRLGRSFLSEGD